MLCYHCRLEVTSKEELLRVTVAFPSNVVRSQVNVFHMLTKYIVCFVFCNVSLCCYDVSFLAVTLWLEMFIV